jgi:hypothetical protein
VEDKREVKIRKSTPRQINACRAGAFPKIVEEVDEVYLMTLTEQTEMDAFLEEALATGRIRLSGDTGGISTSDWSRPP